jgi:hypothetical protein
VAAERRSSTARSRGSNRIPLAHIAPNGTLYGSGGHGSSKVAIKGRFTGSGNTAVLKFPLPNQGCQSGPLNLVES